MEKSSLGETMCLAVIGHGDDDHFGILFAIHVLMLIFSLAVNQKWKKKKERRGGGEGYDDAKGRNR